VQWARKKGNVVVDTSTRRLTLHGYVQTTYCADEIDGITAYCQELKRCYYLPIELLPADVDFIFVFLPPPTTRSWR
jgi:hypothetical protein